MVFDDSFCNDYVDTSIMSDNELGKSVNLYDYHWISRAKSEWENSFHKPRCSKFDSFDKFPEIFDHSDTGTVYDSTAPSTDKTNSSLHVTQSQASKTISLIKWDLGPQTRKK